MHWAWKFDTVITNDPPTANHGIEVRSGANEQFTFRIRRLTGDPSLQDGAQYFIDIDRNGTTVGTAGPYWSREWYVFEAKFTVHPSTGAVELRRSHRGKEAWVTDLNITSVNTADTGSSGADNFELLHLGNSGTLAVDDFIVKDTTGTLNNDFFATPRHIFFMQPDADGAQLDWLVMDAGSTKIALDDPPATDQTGSGGDIDRITSEVIGDISLVSVDNIPDLGTNANVDALVVESFVGMENSGTRTIRHLYRNSVDVRAGGSTVVLNDTVFAMFRQIWEQEPIAAAAWTKTQLEQAQFGYEVTA